MTGTTGPVEDPATGPSRPVTDNDDLQLAEQLRALEDLEAEFAAGDLDEADYRTLRDDYTVRVADAMRKLEGTAPVTPRPFRSRARRLGPAVLVAVAVFAVGAGWLLARSAGERGVNDGLTGEIASNRQRVFQWQELGVDGRIVASLPGVDEVLTDAPDTVAALTSRGWDVILTTSSAQATGQDQEAEELLEVGRTYLDRAVEVDPSFPDARAFRAAVFDRLGQAEAACAEVADLLALDPPPFFVEQTRAIVDRNDC